MRKDCKYSYSCLLRMVSAEFARRAGIEIRETPCCVECLYFKPKDEVSNDD